MRCKFSFLWAILAVVACIGMPVSAWADIQLTLAETGSGSPVAADSINNAGPVGFSGPVGADFTVFMSTGFSNSPGTPGNALAQQGAITITDNASSGTQVLTITVSAQGFTSPNSPPPLSVLDTVSGSVVTGAVSGTAQGYADATDALNGTGFTAGSLAFSATGLSVSFGNALTGDVPGFIPNGAAYSLTLVETLTIDAGTELTLTGGNIQAMPTPAPAGAVLALTGLPFLGIGAWVRRRRQQV